VPWLPYSWLSYSEGGGGVDPSPHRKRGKSVNDLLATFKELGEKYEVPLVDVEDEVERVFSEVLSEKLRADIQVFLQNGAFRIYRFDSEGIFEVDPTKIPKSAILEAKERLEYKLNCLSTYKIYLDAKKLTRTIVVGVIRRIINRDLYVEFKNEKAVFKKSQYLIGVCPYKHQTPKERPLYRVGMVLPFLVTSVRGEMVYGAPRVIIILSRNSISFPVVMLKKFLEEDGIFIKLEPVRRIAGGYTIIKASQKVPKEYIKKVSNLLKEGLIVRY
jgi:hypothetical protein